MNIPNRTIRLHIKHFVSRYFFLFFLLFTNSCGAGTFIRVNQVGFLPDDYKSAVILSDNNLAGKNFSVINESGEKIFSETIGPSVSAYGNFNYVHKINFSGVTAPGEYYIETGKTLSVTFAVSNNLYNKITENLLSFFRVQRCGYTNPLLHKTCHIADVTGLIDNNYQINEQLDVTGGWHDAGDYTKFLNTTAFTTYMLLFSYEFDPVKFGFDKDKNSVPDILEEAKIGLDWLLRAQYKKSFITQVQDVDDQNVGWRMPEDDPLAFDRPGFTGIGKNLIGIYVAAMSAASRIWRDKIHYPEFADRCLTAAENYYSLKDNVPNVDSSGTGKYLDKNYAGKLGLGALELYESTNRPALLNDAKKYGRIAGSDYWWSWGDLNSLLHYKLSLYDTSFVKYIEKNLEHFAAESDSSIFDMGVSLSWGTNQAMMGVALQSLLYKRITGIGKYDKLAEEQRDFVLGRNPWGVSFIYGQGEVFTQNFHHQVAYFNNGRLPGGFAAGPVNKEIFKDYEINFDKPDRFSKFQSPLMVYYDDRNDYITNEPTISANVTAVFVMGYYSGK